MALSIGMLMTIAYADICYLTWSHAKHMSQELMFYRFQMLVGLGGLFRILKNLDRRRESRLWARKTLRRDVVVLKVLGGPDRNQQCLASPLVFHAGVCEKQKSFEVSLCPAIQRQKLLSSP